MWGDYIDTEKHMHLFNLFAVRFVSRIAYTAKLLDYFIQHSLGFSFSLEQLAPDFGRPPPKVYIPTWNQLLMVIS
jgi:hypothetical protein